MVAPAGGYSAGADDNNPPRLVAGRVGRAHGLDGSFYVTGARPRLLTLGATVTVAGRAAEVTRRSGTDEHPIVRLQGVEDRGAVEAMRGLELTVDPGEAPALGEGEWWASELEGCEVVDGGRHVGVVVGLLELPSCEALEVRLATSGLSRAEGPAGDQKGELLVPMVGDAIRTVDITNRRIDVDMDFLGEVP